MTPLVSICIPTYNASRTIRKTLVSILAQTYPNIEVIVSDNASTDDTVAIIEALGDPRVQVIRGETNIGGEANFEKCLRLGRGPYTAVYHADDIYTPTMVERQVAFLEATPEAGAVFTAGRMIDPEDHDLGPYPMPATLHHATAPLSFDQPTLARMILRYGNFVICPSVLARTAVYQQEIGIWNGRQFGSSADLDVWLRIVERHALGFLPEPLIHYRRSQQQGSHQIHYLRTAPPDILKVLDHHLATPAWQAFLTEEDLGHYRRFLLKELVVRACNAHVKGDHDLARTLLQEADAAAVWGGALASKRDFFVLATWLTLQLSQVAPSLTLPVLRRISQRVA